MKSCRSRDRTHVPYIDWQILNHWTTVEVQENCILNHPYLCCLCHPDLTANILLILFHSHFPSSASNLPFPWSILKHIPHLISLTIAHTSKDRVSGSTLYPWAFVLSHSLASSQWSFWKYRQDYSIVLLKTMQLLIAPSLLTSFHMTPGLSSLDFSHRGRPYFCSSWGHGSSHPSPCWESPGEVSCVFRSQPPCHHFRGVIPEHRAYGGLSYFHHFLSHCSVLIIL